MIVIRQIDRVIKVAGEEDVKAFKHLFTKTSRKNFADGHLWFSIFAKPANSVGLSYIVSRSESGHAG